MRSAAKEHKDLLGRKVSILFRLSKDPEHPFNEAFGVVQRVEEGVLFVAKRDGTLIEVKAIDIVQMKVIG